jgi:hypothetical protein
VIDSWVIRDEEITLPVKSQCPECKNESPGLRRETKEYPHCVPSNRHFALPCGHEVGTVLVTVDSSGKITAVDLEPRHAD